MIGYVTLGTNDLARAAAFYDALCAEFGELGLQVAKMTAFDRSTRRHGLRVEEEDQGPCF